MTEQQTAEQHEQKNEQCIEVACYGRNKDHAYRLWNTRKGESHE